MSYNWLDIVAGVLLFITTFRGFRRGLVRSIFDILSIIVAIFVAAQWNKDLSAIILQVAKLPETVATVLAFALIFIIAFFLVDIIGSTLHKFVKSSLFAPLNMLGGVLLGLAMGAVIVILILQMVISFPLPDTAREYLKTSITLQWARPFMQNSYATLFKTMPLEIPQVADILKMIPKTALSPTLPKFAPLEKPEVKVTASAKSGKTKALKKKKAKPAIKEK